MPLSRPAALAAALLLAPLACAPVPPASPRGGGVGSRAAPAALVVTGARVWTGDPARPEAEALAVGADGRLLAVGAEAEVRALAGPATRVVEAGGRRVIPGLNDSHLHAVRGGRFYAAELRWDGVPTLAEAMRRVAEQAARTPDGEWVRVVGGWSPYQFAERAMPTPAALTEAAPDTPTFVLYLYSRGFLNAAGVRALGITDTTTAPAGGRYELTPDGGAVLHAEPDPTILYKTIGALPGLSEPDKALSTRHFYRELARLGLTSAVDAGGGGHVFPTDYTGTDVLAQADEMPIRISYYLFPQRPGREVADFEGWTTDYQAGRNAAETLAHGYELEGGGEFLVWSAGDFENFLAPRPDLAERDYESDLRAATTTLVRAGWPLRIHATYDESIGRILDIFEAVDRDERAAGRDGFGGVRWAVDHAETLRPANLARIQALGGGVAVQSRMAYAGEDFADRYGAAAARNAPPLRQLLDAGVPVGAGTDGTRVGSYDPWPALAWLVTGRTVGGLQLAAPENRLSRAEALALYTVGSAWFSQEEDVKGLLASGQYADFAVLSDDYFSVPEGRIGQIESVLTVVGGRVVYGAAEFAGLVPALPAIAPSWSPVRHYGGVYRAGR